MNVSDRLEERLGGAAFSVLRSISRTASRLGVEVYVVGGTVRDALTDESPVDVDIMASRETERLVESIVGQGSASVRKASEFGTWSLTVQDIELDLSTARRETYRRPGALPTVFPGTIDDDLARRDFTINAMAISLNGDSWGDLLDPHGGVKDLEGGLIRVLHDRSFIDDATRVLRAIRYACRRDSQLEARTSELLEQGLPYLSAISPDRVRREIERIFNEPRSTKMVDLAGRLGVLTAVHPALRVDSKSLLAIDAAPEADAQRAELLLGSIVQSIGDDDVDSVVERLNLNAEWAWIVRDVVEVHGRTEDLMDENIAKSRVYRLLHGLNGAAIESCAMAETDPKVAARLRLYLDELRHVRTSLDGNNLIALGVPQGPVLGQMLDKLLDAKLDGLVESAEDECGLARQLHEAEDRN